MHRVGQELTQQGRDRAARRGLAGRAGLPGREVEGNCCLDPTGRVVEVGEVVGGVDAGGHPIGKLGPVPEGLVAWTLGIGVCVVLTLWIGARR